MTFLYGVADWGGIKFGDYVYPGWAEGVGWLLAFSSMITIPIGMIHTLYQTYKNTGYSVSGDGTSWREVTYFTWQTKAFAYTLNSQDN